MTQLQVWDEVQGWTPKEKWTLVEALLRDLQAHSSDPSASAESSSSSLSTHQTPTPLGNVPTRPAATVMSAVGMFDLNGNAQSDTEALYD